jgi:hypothetical protein
MHLALKRGTKTSIILGKLVEFLVISILHETKIPTIDMEVQVYSKFRNKFRKNKNWKNGKSPTFMRNESCNTSKCRGKLQKMVVLYTHSPKMLGSSSKVPKKNFKKHKKIWKNW